MSLPPLLQPHFLDFLDTYLCGGVTSQRDRWCCCAAPCFLRWSARSSSRPSQRRSAGLRRYLWAISPVAPQPASSPWMTRAKVWAGVAGAPPPLLREAPSRHHLLLLPAPRLLHSCSRAGRRSSRCRGSAGCHSMSSCASGPPVRACGPAC